MDVKSVPVVVLVLAAFSSGLPHSLSERNGHSLFISNGTDASKGEFPHIVQVKRNGSHVCAGSILSESSVVTSCRCVSGNASEYKLIAGEHDLNQVEGSEQTREVLEIICHPFYNSGTFTNDVVIVKTATPFDLNNIAVRAISIQPSVNPTTTNSFTVAGWGETAHEGKESNILQKDTVHLQSSRRCTSSAVGDTLDPGMLCAGTLEQGPCSGDGGDPMMANGYLYGFVSFRNSCGYYGVVSVYTNTTYYYNWIMSQIN